MLICLMASVSCIDRPESVLSEKEMIDLLVDVHRSEGLLDLQSGHAFSDEEFQQAVMASVLVDHGVTRAQYDSSLMWYAKHLKLFVRVYSHVDEKLEDEAEYWNQLVADSREFKISEAGDSVELWSINDYLVLDRPLRTAARFWEIPKDSNYLAGDTMRWTFDVVKLAKGQKILASMSLRSDEDDFEFTTSSYKDMMLTYPVGTAGLLIEEDGTYQFDVVPEPDKHFGSLILNLNMLSPDTLQSPTFLRDISLKRYHRHD